MTKFLRRVFSCRHVNSIREHREDGWYWVCSTCGRAGLLNPRDHDTTQPARGKGRLHA
jgi:hypothetical protein